MGIGKRLLIAAGVSVVIWIAKIAACWLALRVHSGTKPIPVDEDERLWRSALAAAGLTLLTPLEIFALTDAFRTGLKSTFFWVTAFAVVPLGGLFLMWVYALEDYLDGVGVFALYCVVPVAVLLACWLASVPVTSWLLRVPYGG